MSPAITDGERFGAFTFAKFVYLIPLVGVLFNWSSNWSCARTSTVGVGTVLRVACR